MFLYTFLPFVLFLNIFCGLLWTSMDFSGLLCSGFWWWTFLDSCGLLWTFVDLWNFVESYGLCWTLVDFGEQNHFFLYNVLLHFPRNWVVWWDRMHFSSKVIKIGQFPSNSLDIMRYLMRAPTLWQYGLWSFQTGCTKLERFLHKN